MSVHQTREYFKSADGCIVDNPNIGPTLTKHCWNCGNSKAFLDIVKDLTGKELSGTAWVNKLMTDVEVLAKSERTEYDKMLQKKKTEQQ